MEKDILLALESIGLNRNEAIVYLDLIKAGNSSAVEISKRTGIHRPNVYDSVAKLIKKGLIKESTESDKKLFSAMGSASLLSYVRQKEFELQKVLHLIDDVDVTDGNIGSYSMVISGLNEIEKQFHELIGNDEILVYGMPSELGGFRIMFDRLMKKCGNAGTKIRIIYSSPVGTNRLNSRFLATKFDSKMTTFISGTKVLLFFWNSDSVVLINDRSISGSYRAYFDKLWENAKFNKP